MVIILSLLVEHWLFCKLQPRGTRQWFLKSHKSLSFTVLRIQLQYNLISGTGKYCLDGELKASLLRLRDVLLIFFYCV